MNTPTLTADNLEEPHEPHWISRAAFPVISGALIVAQGGLAWAVYQAQWWLAVPLVLIVSHLMHGQLIGFHEASHGLLRKSRTLNNFDGVLIGMFSFMSFTLYRAAHQSHHMHLSSERDEELWPFVDPTMPRWARVVAALVELNVGILFTPFLFMRTFLRANSPIRSPRVRRRIWNELFLTWTVWTLVISAVAYFSAWQYFIWLYLIPAVIAGNLQSWRKYIEHVGLTGSTIRSATRSIIPKGPLGHLTAFTLLHEPYHGVHHQRAGISHAELPQYAADLHPEHEDECAPFPSYRSAFVHLFRCLADPRVGPQWRQMDSGAN